jgi:hypothetical protein
VEPNDSLSFSSMAMILKSVAGIGAGTATGCNGGNDGISPEEDDDAAAASTGNGVVIDARYYNDHTVVDVIC